MVIRPIGCGQMLPSKVSMGWWLLSVLVTSPCSFYPISLTNLNLCVEAPKDENLQNIFKTMPSLGRVPTCTEKNYFWAWGYFFFMFIYVQHATMRTSTKPGKFGKVQMTNIYINSNLANKLNYYLGTKYSRKQWWSKHQILCCLNAHYCSPDGKLLIT